MHSPVFGFVEFKIVHGWPRRRDAVQRCKQCSPQQWTHGSVCGSGVEQGGEFCLRSSGRRRPSQHCGSGVLPPLWRFFSKAARPERPRLCGSGAPRERLQPSDSSVHRKSTQRMHVATIVQRGGLCTIAARLCRERTRVWAHVHGCCERPAPRPPPAVASTCTRAGWLLM